MKITYHISIFCLFLMVSTSFAQVRLGAFAGINSTGFAGDDPPNGNFASDLGYGAGIIGEYYLLEDITVNIQPMFTNRSTIIQYDVKYQYEQYDSIRIDIEYFELPLNVKVQADNKMSYVTAGIVWAVPLTANAINNSSGRELNIDDRFSSSVLKATFGVGMQFNIGKPLMFIELSYTQSLTNLTKIEIGEIELNNKLKSNSFQLSTGILFSL